MSKVDEAVIEINAALDDMVPAHEGLRDYARLQLTSEAMEAVNAAMSQYNRRQTRLLEALSGLGALQKDGYPDLVIEPVSLSALEDLTANKDTIDAALAAFATNAAASLGLDAAPPEPKRGSQK